MVLHAHPTKFTAEILGIIWSVYFLWNQNWIGAVVASLLGFLGSTFLVWREPIDHLPETRLGKVMAVYGKPFNFFLYNISALPVIYGLWNHQALSIMVGVSIMLSPHLWAWKSTNV
jgi:hypothetical protein